MTDKKKNRKYIVPIIALMLAAVITGICIWYVNDYYRADWDAIELFMKERSIIPEQRDEHILVFEPEQASAGFIFYPGGKVEESAYIPLMQECAENGILCVLVKMPFNLAVLDVNAADGIQELYPQITDWYIGGHSLGGSMAAAYLEKHGEDYEGLILLGAYSTTDLSDTKLKVLSVYGSEDKVLNKEKYTSCERNLPNNYQEMEMEGGCHAYFGMYGPQDGDGLPSITNEEQICMTAERIIDMVQDEKVEFN